MSHSFVLLIVAATTYTHLYPNPDHMYVSTEAQECMDEFQTIVQPSLSLHTLHATSTDRDRQKGRQTERQRARETPADFLP